MSYEADVTKYMKRVMSYEADVNREISASEREIESLRKQLASMKSICHQQHVALVQASNSSYLGKNVAEAIAAYEKMFGEE